MSTNSDVLTPDKLRELKTRINGYEPNLMMIQETKPKNFNRTLTKAEYTIPNYDMEWKNMEEEKVGRGLITYVKSGINYKLVTYDIPFIEYLAMSIELNDTEKLLAINMYRSPNSENINNESLNKLILRIAAENKYDFILLTGDGNYKHIDWQQMTCSSSENSNDFLFLESFKDSFFEQHINEPTRGRGSDKPSVLDLGSWVIYNHFSTEYALRILRRLDIRQQTENSLTEYSPRKLSPYLGYLIFAEF